MPKYKHDFFVLNIFSVLFFWILEFRSSLENFCSRNFDNLDSSLVLKCTIFLEYFSLESLRIDNGYYASAESPPKNIPELGDMRMLQHIYIYAANKPVGIFNWKYFFAKKKKREDFCEMPK